MGASIRSHKSLAQIGSKFLRAIADNVKETRLVKSTVELFRKFEEYNSVIKKNVPGFLIQLWFGFLLKLSWKYSHISLFSNWSHFDNLFALFGLCWVF